MAGLDFTGLRDVNLSLQNILIQLSGLSKTISALTVPQRINPNFSYRDISLLPTGVVVGRYCAVLNWTLPSVANGLVVAGRVDTAPGADTDFLLLKDGASVVTVRFASGSHTPTVIAAADTAFLAVTDYLDLKMPASLNGMAGPFGLAALGNVTG